MPAHCIRFDEAQGRGTRADGSTLMEKGGAPVYSAFFQQSSFGTYAIANERFAVKVRADAPLERLGPMACSIQTGAGAVFNAMRPQPGDSIVVFGVGGVGLSALMAAKLAGCDPIIAVDIQEEPPGAGARARRDARDRWFQAAMWSARSAGSRATGRNSPRDLGAAGRAARGRRSA